MDHRRGIPAADDTSPSLASSAQSWRRSSRITTRALSFFFFSFTFLLSRAPKGSASRDHSPNKALSVYRMRNRRERGDDNWRRQLTRTTTMIIGIDQKEESIGRRCLARGSPRRRPRRSRRPVRLVDGLWAAALLDHHARQSREHDLILVVEVQHRDLGQFPRRAARPGIVRRFRQADDVRVGIGRKKSHRTVTRAVIGIVSATQRFTEPIVNAGSTSASLRDWFSFLEPCIINFKKILDYANHWRLKTNWVMREIQFKKVFFILETNLSMIQIHVV